MNTPDQGPFGPIKDAWHLYQAMTEELAHEYAEHAFVGNPQSATWTGMAERIDQTKAALYEFAGPGATPKERRHHRHERREVGSLNEILDQTHESLVDLAESELAYLKLEQTAKQTIADGGSVDASGLEVARSRMARSREALRQCRSTLSYRIENLADETGSGLFTPQDDSG
jgi:hypothetical protein